MGNLAGFYGREHELSVMDSALRAVGAGEPRAILLCGEPGIGKTHLARAFVERSGWRIIDTALGTSNCAVYGVMTGLLRAYLRTGATIELPPALAMHLAALIPEIGGATSPPEPTTLREAMNRTFIAVANEQPTILLADDLHRADRASLDYLPELVHAVSGVPLILLATAQTRPSFAVDPMRRARFALRRAGALCEVALTGLDQSASERLAHDRAGRALNDDVAARLHQRCGGVPLFVEALAAAIADGDVSHYLPAARAPVAPHWMPVPETTRDTLLGHLELLTDVARTLLNAAAVAAVADPVTHIDVLAAVTTSEDGVDELLGSGLFADSNTGELRFHHDMVRDALYQDLSWSRRRWLHGALADELSDRRAPPQVLAVHWLAAGERSRARDCLRAAARRSYDEHDNTGALDFGRAALDLDGDAAALTEAQRRAHLDDLGLLAHVNHRLGRFEEACGLWREVGTGREELRDLPAAARAARALAVVSELAGDAATALEARGRAATLFTHSAMPADAAAERLTAASQLRNAARFEAALTVLASATEDARAADDVDLQARVLALQGNVRARAGDAVGGVCTVRQALTMALEHRRYHVAGEAHQRLADALEHTGDYQAATTAYEGGIAFCHTHNVSATAQVCVACMTSVLRQTGQWKLAHRLCREVLSNADGPGHARAVAASVLGLIHALRGQSRRAAAPLLEGAALGREVGLASLDILTLWGEGLVSEQRESGPEVTDLCRRLLSRWAQTEDRHYAIPALRWAAGWLARAGEPVLARTVADALAQIANDTGRPEALAALAHALGVTLAAEREFAEAMVQLEHALERLRELVLPYELADSSLTAGLVAAELGRPDVAADHLRRAMRTARHLGARPLAAAATRQRNAPVDSAVSAARQPAELTRRQLQVLEFVAEGLTDRDIAGRLFLSVRTVEMHVGNLLQRLDCRSRGEAVHRAKQLGLLGH